MWIKSTLTDIWFSLSHADQIYTTSGGAVNVMLTGSTTVHQVRSFDTQAEADSWVDGLLNKVKAD
jgi:hypothetical protein